MPELLEQIGKETKIEPHVEAELTPEQIIIFDQYIKEGLSLEYISAFGDGKMANWEDFLAEFKSNYSRQKARYLEARKLWFEIKKTGEKFRFYIERKIDESLATNNSHGLFKLLGLYQNLNYKGSSAVFQKCLDHPAVWADWDGSNIHNILRIFSKTKDKNAIEAILRYIDNVFSENYQRKDHQSNDLGVATAALYSIMGDEAIDVLGDKAETVKALEKTIEFQSIFQISPHWKEEEIKFQEFNEEQEQANIETLETLLNQNTIPQDDQDISDNFDDEPSPFWDEPDETSEYKPEIRHEPKKLINFYGRFKPKIEKPVIIDDGNLARVLLAAIKSSDHEEYLNFLYGVTAEKENGPASLEVTEEDIRKAVSLSIGRAVCLAILENNKEQSLSVLKKLEQVLLSMAEKIPDVKGSERIRHFIFRNFKLITEVLGRYKDEDINTDLPRSAESFLIYNARRGKSRQIPDFRKLLGEKIVWLLVNKLNEISGDNSYDSGRRVFDVVYREYSEGLKLYKEVQKSDVPVYWEAHDKLGDFDADRVVVFGRDGRWFFTALKAVDFGINERTLKYVVVSRGVQGNESKEKIAKYLQQNGVSLDFTFVDTGFRGSIPELAIRVLAGAGGIEISDKEIDRRIKLLSTSELRRSELSRKSRSSDRSSAVQNIEERPQPYDSPEYLVLDEKTGKLGPNIVPESTSSQLQAWVVEHASFRNFAPRLNPEKKVEYLQTNPMEGYEYVQDLRATSIGTHPMEIWKDKNGNEVIIKGGPEHTVRADFLGQLFLNSFRIYTPPTEIIEKGRDTKLQIQYLKKEDGWMPGEIHLAEQYSNDENIQRGFLIDALLGQYDRTPWNFMFNKNGQVAFIDNGASVFSRARGGHKGFPDNFNIEQLEEILENPQFPGEPVNDAYNNLIQVRDGEVVILKPGLMKQFLAKFDIKTNNLDIDGYVDQAGYKDGRRSVREMEATISQLEEELKNLTEGTSDYRKTVEAIETYKKAIQAGGQASYLKAALKKRRDDIIRLIGEKLSTQRE